MKIHQVAGAIAVAFFAGGIFAVALGLPFPRVDNTVSQLCVGALERSTDRLRQAVDSLEVCSRQRDENLELARQATRLADDGVGIASVYAMAVVNCIQSSVTDVRACLIDKVQRGMVRCGAACATPTPLVPPESVVGPQASGGTPFAEAIAWCRSAGADFNADNLANCVGMNLGIGSDSKTMPYGIALQACEGQWPEGLAQLAVVDQIIACVHDRLGIPQ